MSPRRRHGPGLLAVLLLPFIAACGDGDEPRSGTHGDAGDDAGAPPSALYAEVERILARSCAFERCHSGAILGGMLDLTQGYDYHGALVGVTACEYERMARVTPFEPDRSWLIVKLTAPFRPADDPYAYYIHFEPDADWDPEARACRDRTADGTPLFGQRMPLTAPNRLPEAELDTLRAWIEAGAPR